MNKGYVCNHVKGEIGCVPAHEVTIVYVIASQVVLCQKWFSEMEQDDCCQTITSQRRVHIASLAINQDIIAMIIFKIDWFRRKNNPVRHRPFLDSWASGICINLHVSFNFLMNVIYKIRTYIKDRTIIIWNAKFFRNEMLTFNSLEWRRFDICTKVYQQWCQLLRCLHEVSFLNYWHVLPPFFLITWLYTSKKISLHISANKLCLFVWA